MRVGSLSRLGIDHESVAFAPPEIQLHSQAPNPIWVVLYELRASVCAEMDSCKASLEMLGQLRGGAEVRDGGFGTHEGEVLGRRETT